MTPTLILNMSIYLQLLRTLLTKLLQVTYFSNTTVNYILLMAPVRACTHTLIQAHYSSYSTSASQ